MSDQLTNKILGLSHLAGIEIGGIPIATVFSQMTQQPTLFVRKEAT
jgi:orotate phosphoribosyltransferase